MTSVEMGFRLGRADDWPASLHDAADRYERAVAAMNSCRTEGDVEAAVAVLDAAKRAFGREMLMLDRARREAAERRLPKLDVAKLRQILDRLIDEQYIGGADPLVLEVFGQDGAKALQSATTGFPDQQAGPAIALVQRLFPGWPLTLQISADGTAEATIGSGGEVAVIAQSTLACAGSVGRAIAECVIRALITKASSR